MLTLMFMPYRLLRLLPLLLLAFAIIFFFSMIADAMPLCHFFKITLRHAAMRCCYYVMPIVARHIANINHSQEYATLFIIVATLLLMRSAYYYTLLRHAEC